MVLSKAWMMNDGGEEILGLAIERMTDGRFPGQVASRQTNKYSLEQSRG